MIYIYSLKAKQTVHCDGSNLEWRLCINESLSEFQWREEFQGIADMWQGGTADKDLAVAMLSKLVKGPCVNAVGTYLLTLDKDLWGAGDILSWNNKLSSRYVGVKLLGKPYREGHGYTYVVRSLTGNTFPNVHSIGDTLEDKHFTRTTILNYGQVQKQNKEALYSGFRSQRGRDKRRKAIRSGLGL